LITKLYLLLSLLLISLSLNNCFFESNRNAGKLTAVVPTGEQDTSLKLVKILPWSFAVSYSIEEIPLSYEQQKEALQDEKEDWNDHVEETEKVFKKIPFEIMSQEEIIEKMEEYGQENFIDPHFPPRDISIFNVVEEEYPYKFIVEWRRPHEFMDNPQVFEDDIDPNDIKQGILGDCWFLSATASLAERPGMVRRLFITKEYNPEGVYQIKLCKNGEWVTVTVDDYIPCRYKGGPIFSRGATNEIWVMLLEKAYAKLHGNYQALSSGQTKHAMADLSGCPTYEIAFPKNRQNYRQVQDECEKIFDKLKELDDEGYLMNTGTSGVDTITEGDGPGAGRGLVSGHAYSILQVKEG